MALAGKRFEVRQHVTVDKQLVGTRVEFLELAHHVPVELLVKKLQDLDVGLDQVARLDECSGDTLGIQRHLALVEALPGDGLDALLQPEQLFLPLHAGLGDHVDHDDVFLELLVADEFKGLRGAGNGGRLCLCLGGMLAQHVESNAEASAKIGNHSRFLDPYLSQ